jgi:hypothetical protein
MRHHPRVEVGESREKSSPGPALALGVQREGASQRQAVAKERPKAPNQKVRREIVEDLVNRAVRFQVADIVHPRPVQVLLELFRHLSLEGEVVASTTDGATPYVVVRVAGLTDAVIVPLAKTSAFFDDEGSPLGVPAAAGG